MIATIIVGCTICVLLVLVCHLTRASSMGADALQVWEAHSSKVNVDTVRLLVDDEEAAYLWKSVSPVEFRRLQRRRILLALRSVRMIARNAALLVRVATQARQADDREVAGAAEGLMFLAFRVGTNALVVEFYLLLKWIFPAVAISVPIQVERYERLLEKCDWMLTRRQQHPAHPPIAG